jgi:hypothetical protein
MHTASLREADLSSIMVVVSFGDESGYLNLLKPLHLDGDFIFIATSSLPSAASIILHLAAVSLLDQLPVRALLVPAVRNSQAGKNNMEACGVEVSLLPIIGGVSSLSVSGPVSTQKETLASDISKISLICINMDSFQ